MVDRDTKFRTSGSMNSSEIDEKVKKSLEGTRFAASTFTKLEGGLVNWTYKATLSKALDDGTAQVTIKHGEDFVQFRPDYKVSVDRCRNETEALKILTESPIEGESNTSDRLHSFKVRTPKHHHYDDENVNQFTEYLPNAVNLKTYARAHFGPNTPVSLRPQCQELGRAIGSWMRGFHEWGQKQDELRRLVAATDAQSRAVTKMVNFAWMQDRVKRWPDVLGSMADTLKEVEEMTDHEWETEEAFQLVHGDLGPGNTILPNELLSNEGGTDVFIIDWEVIQLGVRAVDVGLMLADFYALWRYQSIDGGLWLMHGFVEGYEDQSETSVYRTLIQMGGHLLCHSTDLEEWGDEDKRKEVAQLGAEIIVHAWRKDRKWFENGELGFVFKDVKP